MLDVGAGTGILGYKLHEKGLTLNMVGVDASTDAQNEVFGSSCQNLLFDKSRAATRLKGRVYLWLYFHFGDD